MSQNTQHTSSLQFSDGRVYHGNAQNILDLVEQFTNQRVKVLRVVDINVGQYRQVFDRLERSRVMGQLVDLNVGISYPAGTTAFLPRLRLVRMRFPSLRRLALDGAYIATGSDVVSALAVLQLSNYDRSPGPSVPVEDLRRDLSMATSLSELRISRALEGIDFGNGHINLPITTIPSLRIFDCEDQAIHIHDFLSHIDIQSRVQVKLTPLIPEDSARTHWAVQWLQARSAGARDPYELRETYESAQFMPADYEPLASLIPSLALGDMVPGSTAPSILGSIASINISKHTMSNKTNVVSFVANAQDGGRLAFEVPSRSHAELFQLQNSALCLISAHIAIRRAPAAPLTMLIIALDLDCIDPFNWDQLFSGIPSLESLHVTDTSPFDPIALGAIELLRALRRPTRTRESANLKGVVAPRLKMVSLTRVMYSGQLLNAILTCMAERTSGNYYQDRGRRTLLLRPTVLDSLALNYVVAIGRARARDDGPNEADIEDFRRAMQTVNPGIRLSIEPHRA